MIKRATGRYRNICQRPTASKALRKCSMVGIFSIVGPDDRDNVKPAPLVREIVLAEELNRGIGQSPLLFRRDRLRGSSLTARL